MELYDESLDLIEAAEIEQENGFWKLSLPLIFFLPLDRQKQFITEQTAMQEADSLSKKFNTTIYFDNLDESYKQQMRYMRDKVFSDISETMNKGVNKAYEIFEGNQIVNPNNVAGLTEKQILAISNYYDSLKMESIKRREIKRRLNKMIDRQIRQRAKLIAMTEGTRARTVAKQLIWNKAMTMGIIDSNHKQFWVVTPDDRLCDHCMATPGLNPDGRSLNEPFDSTLGLVSGPPLHPHCRCDIELRKV